MACPVRASLASPFCYFNSSPEVIRLVVMMYVRRSGWEAERCLHDRPASAGLQREINIGHERAEISSA